ncbi:MAG: cytochrome c biogenesis protein CcdA [Candidatus ainarchaeum sp.]|nr:cytochrome c biogenesis protein CcdA [Candidatus ainarchaeum sp.]
MTPNKKRLIISLSLLVGIILIFIVLSLINQDSIKNFAGSLPLPILTILVGLLDGFNPCTFFVFGLILSLLVSVSDSRKKMLAVALSFIIVVFVIYFLFMSAWLTVLSVIGFVDILRIIVGIIAIIAGLINWKEFIWFRKGITLMIQDKDKAKVTGKIQALKDKITSGTILSLIGASVLLALFTSMIEIPCTVGLPLIYTTILSQNALGFSHYLYILLYCLIYVIPLLAISGWFIYSFKEKTISKKQMQWIKLITGLIMVVLGIIILFWPKLLI